MNKGTKEIIKNIAIIVLVPTVLVGAYYGGKFIHKKYKEKKQRDKENEDALNAKKSTETNDVNVIDTTGMAKYTINIPLKLQQELFSNGKFFDSISKVNYSFQDELVEGDTIKVNIMALPSKLGELTSIVKKVNDEITVVPTA